MCGRPQFRICFTAMDYLEEARKSPVRSQPKKGFYLCPVSEPGKHTGLPLRSNRSR